MLKCHFAAWWVEAPALKVNVDLEDGYVSIKLKWESDIIISVTGCNQLLPERKSLQRWILKSDLLDTDLLPNGMCLGHHPLDVMPFWSPLQHELLDLQLQLGVGPLQRAHLVQVVGQPVVEALHGLLLAGADSEAVEGEVGAQHVEAVAHRDGAGQRADGDGRLGADAASAVPHRHAGEGRLTYRVAAHREGGGHGVRCRRFRWKFYQWRYMSAYLQVHKRTRSATFVNEQDKITDH